MIIMSRDALIKKIKKEYFNKRKEIHSWNKECTELKQYKTEYMYFMMPVITYCI